MKYPNAYAGTNKLYKSELLNIISTVLMLAALVFALFTGEDSPSDDMSVFFLAFTVLSIISGVIGIIAFILQFVGINQARKDEPLFKNAIYFIVICFICTLALTVSNGMFGRICAGIDEVSTLLINVYVIIGIYNLADLLNHQAVQRRGKLTLLLMTIFFGITFVLHLVRAFIPEIADNLGVIGTLLELAGYIISLMYLGKARKMLAA